MRSEATSWLRPIAILAGMAMPASAAAAGLNLIPDATIVATNIALFLLLIYPVNRLLVRPLMRILDERESRTSGALAQSQQLGDEARAARSALEEQLAEARATSQMRRTAILADGEIQERAVLDAVRAEATGIIEGVRQSVRLGTC